MHVCKCTYLIQVLYITSAAIVVQYYFQLMLNLIANGWFEYGAEQQDIFTTLWNIKDGCAGFCDSLEGGMEISLPYLE